jgi:hypothetical protein
MFAPFYIHEELVIYYIEPCQKESKASSCVTYTACPQNYKLMCAVQQLPHSL